MARHKAKPKRPFVDKLECGRCGTPLGVVDVKGVRIPFERNTRKSHDCPTARCNRCGDYIVWFQANDSKWTPFSTDGTRHACQPPTCKYCGAQIEWKQLPNKSMIPLDPHTRQRHTCPEYERYKDWPVSK